MKEVMGMMCGDHPATIAAKAVNYLIEIILSGTGRERETGTGTGTRTGIGAEAEIEREIETGRGNMTDTGTGRVSMMGTVITEVETIMSRSIEVVVAGIENPATEVGVEAEAEVGAVVCRRTQSAYQALT